jgi:light-regulated signal transduction histidine kinase (bacteriophytochrome)
MKPRVLLIEDDAVDRESVHRAISAQFELLDANEGYIGLEMAKTHRPDCVLLDYRLPDIDGIQLLPEIVKENIPVIMMTGVGSESIAVDAMKCGAHDYVSKDAVSSNLLGKMIIQAIQSCELKNQLAKQQEELKNFVSVASHDLRAPLRHIVQSAKLAREECQGKVSDQVDLYLDRIVDGGSRMASLLAALVEFARSGRSAAILEPVNLNEVVKQAIANVSEDVEKSHATIDSQPLPIVVGHEPSLIELMQNIIGNAIKYAGDVVPEIRIESRRDGPMWTVAVRDNGIGIAPKYFEQVFLPFHRLHSHSEISGSGIGLATCKRIVEHHGGRIWVHSELKLGTTLSFTLQAVEDAQQVQSEIGEMIPTC